MNNKQKFNVAGVLMIISALGMIALGVYYANWAPIITAVGFLVTAWFIFVLKKMV